MPGEKLRESPTRNIDQTKTSCGFKVTLLEIICDVRECQDHSDKINKIVEIEDNRDKLEMVVRSRFNLGWHRLVLAIEKGIDRISHLRSSVSISKSRLFPISSLPFLILNFAFTNDIV